jgi:copper transport protein
MIARNRRLFVAALAVFALVCAVAPLFAGTAYAHAALTRANPANNETLRRPPARIVLNFSEDIERELTQIQVTDKDGQNRFDDGAMAFDDNDPTFASVGVKTLDPGLYFVKWSNVSSVDGHGLSGRYPFIVLNPDGSFPEGVSLDNAASTSGGALLPNNLDVAVKWVGLLSLATVFGAAFFLLVVLRPAATFLEDDDFHRATDAGERWLVNLSHVLLPASFIATAFLVLLTWSRFDTSTSIFEYLFHVRSGQYRGIQMIALVVALVGADVLFLGSTRRRRNAGLALLLIATLVTMLSYSMISHSATGDGEFWAVGSDFLHLASSSTWLGALVMLWPVLRWHHPGTARSQTYLFLANAADRFSIVAGISVIVVFATGTFNGLTAIPNAGAMIHTAYGKVLLAKLLLLIPLMAVAGLNAFILKPRLVSAIDTLYQEGGTPDEARRAHHAAVLARVRRVLIRVVVAEIALVLAVFAAVSVLSQTSTASGEIAQDKAAGAAAQKFSQQADAGDLKLLLEVTPNRVGLNEYTLTITKADGTPADTVTQARLRFNYDEVQGAVAPSELVLNKFATGEYRGAGAYFSQPGNWRVDASVRRSDADDVAHTYVLPVARQTATAAGNNDDAFALPFDVFSWNEVAGVIIALAGALIVIYRKQLRWLQQPGYRISMTVAAALLLAGAVLAFGVDTHAKGQGNLAAGNPVPSTQDSIDRGKMLFQQNCISCHGIDGRGDGPDSVNLSPAPTDFRLHMPLHTDPQFYAFIANGYPGSAMPQFANVFSETDIWNLVNFLRSAFSEAPAQ